MPSTNDSPIIDSHVHVLPDSLAKLMTRLPHSEMVSQFVSPERIASVRKKVRNWLRPVSATLHHAQTMSRHLPEPVRRTLDEVSGLVPLPSLFVESTPGDLLDSMAEAKVDYSVVIAHPPYAPTEWALEVCQENPTLIPVVYLEAGTERPGQKLKKYVERGARAVKIHPAADGEGVDSPRYRAIIKAADGLGLPVIVHTGCIHSHLLYKDPEQGHAQRFTEWYSTYKNVTFILAHMNYHAPLVALDLAEEFPNLLLETSWQPAEMVAEAVRRVGATRVLYGSDWPFVGQNQAIGIGRVRDCIDSGFLKEEDSRKVLGQNAARVFKIEAGG